MVSKPSGWNPESCKTGLDHSQSVWMALKRAEGFKSVLNIYITKVESRKDHSLAEHGSLCVIITFWERFIYTLSLYAVKTIALEDGRGSIVRYFARER